MSTNKDITGFRSGLLVAQRPLGNNMWECQCDCGGVVVVRSDHIVRNETKSCGCLGGGKLIDMRGKIIGSFKALERDNSIKGTTKWLCECLKCGKILSIDGYQLRHYHRSHCDCSKTAPAGEIHHNYKHGKSHTRLYNIWQGMLNRCRNPSVKRYNCYGGRGITVCDEWSEFAAFQSWALSHGYGDDLSIDRIDVDGNYEPLNCRWIPMAQQASNRRQRCNKTKDGVNADEQRTKTSSR